MTVKSNGTSVEWLRFQRWRVPLALWLALFMVSFNVYLMTVVIVPIARDLNTALANVQPALVLIALVTASFVPTGQNLGDIYGHKRVFMLGLATFGLGMVVAALSQRVAALILGYAIIAGLGATPLVTLPWTLMNRSYEGRQREYALLTLSLALAAGSVLGPFVGGLIATAAGWRWVFAPQIVLGAIIWFLVQPVKETINRPATSVDWPGGLLSFLGLAAILIGLNLSNDYGWWTPRKLFRLGECVIPPFALSIAPTLIAAGLIFLGLFAVYRRRQRAAREKVLMWRMGLFRRRRFVVGLVTCLFYAIGTAGLTYTLYLFLQMFLGLTSFDAAVAALPYYVTMLLVLLATFQLSQWFTPKFMIQAGLGVLALGLWILFNTLTPGVTPFQLLPPLVVMGAGAGLMVNQLAVLTLSVADAQNQGEANGIYSALQDLGYAVGISIFGVGLIHLIVVGAISSALADLNLTVTKTERQTIIIEVEEAMLTLSLEELNAGLAQLPPEEANALTAAAYLEGFEAMRQTLLAILITVLCALVASLFLPRRVTDRP
ncbi:MAG: MFS transporter [Anaerolineae bacterium]|nr:MFS transporter [Anaerolineae bacterium]